MRLFCAAQGKGGGAEHGGAAVFVWSSADFLEVEEEIGIRYCLLAAGIPACKLEQTYAWIILIWIELRFFIHSDTLCFTYLSLTDTLCLILVNFSSILSKLLLPWCFFARKNLQIFSGKNLKFIQIVNKFDLHLTCSEIGFFYENVNSFLFVHQFWYGGWRPGNARVRYFVRE